MTIEGKLKEEVYASEGYLTGLFWNNPDLYNFYPQEKINTNTFLNKVYGFFFGLGRYMHDKGVKIFDDITTMRYIKELNLEDKYIKYGNYDTISELMQEVEGKEDNIDAYYAEIKKYNLLKSLTDLFGEKVITPTEKYDYKKMTKEQLHIYWNDKVNRLALDGDNKYDEHHLLKGLRNKVKQWSENPAIGLPFFQGRYMTGICTGWDYGNVYIYGGFGGSGKTSFTFNKVIMSCIENKEKLLVIANEQDVDEFQKMLITTAMGVGTKESIKRQRMNEGNFTQEEENKINKAVDWIESIADGDESLITFVFMENYIMDDVKKLIRYYANRGIRRVLIDTGKPSEGKESMARWEVFTEDFKELYKLARPNGGGLNLAVWVNVQLTDTAITRRFLNEHAFGESKKIKNEAAVVFMGRHLWDDEYEGGKHELTVRRWVKTDPSNPFHDKSKEYQDEEIKLSKTDSHGNPNQYYLLFTVKNRRGQDNKTGQQVLVLKPNFNNNTWKEIGWTNVYDDKNY